MPINVNGVSSYTNSSNANRDTISTSFERVSSGSRINSARDDAAGLAIASRFSKEIEGLGVAARNAADGISLTQVADGALSSLNENIARIRELALSSANGTLNDQDRQALAEEAEQLTQENQRLLENTSFNGVSLFTGANEQRFQVGSNAGDQVISPESDLLQALNDLGLNEVDISSQEGASQALSTLDDASQAVSAQASEFGALANRFESTIENLQNSQENQAAARSRVADTDVAAELANLSAALVREQASLAIQAQANTARGFVLQLLQ